MNDVCVLYMSKLAYVVCISFIYYAQLDRNIYNLFFPMTVINYQEILQVWQKSQSAIADIPVFSVVITSVRDLVFHFGTSGDKLYSYTASDC